MSIEFIQNGQVIHKIAFGKNDVNLDIKHLDMIFFNTYYTLPMTEIWILFFVFVLSILFALATKTMETSLVDPVVINDIKVSVSTLVDGLCTPGVVVVGVIVCHLARSIGNFLCF